MRNCMMNAISLGCIAVGSFLLGSSFGLALSKDESDIFDENCIKMEDLDGDYFVYGTSTEITKDIIGKSDNDLRKEAKDSYDRMTKELYGPDRAKIVDPYSHVLDEEASEKLLDDLISDEEVEAFDSTVREITIDGESVTVKQTSEGLEEVGEPYIISEDDFFDPNQYPEFVQENLVYYAKDDVLTTERDEVIYDVDEVVGPNALTSFGSLNLDGDTVFVRNIRLSAEYEITRDEGSYQEIVLGYSDKDEERAYQKAKQYFKKLEEEQEGETS